MSLRDRQPGMSTLCGRMRWIGGALALLLVSTACGGGAADDGGSGEGSGQGLGTLRVVVSVPESLPFIGVQKGKDLGAWEGTGLDVELITSFSAEVGKIMAAGDADIAVQAANTAAANIAKGLEAKLTGGIVLPWGQYVIASTKTKPDATSVEDLVNSTWGISGFGSAGHFSTAKVVEAMGWSEDQYEITPLGGIREIVAALQSGTIDAFTWSAQEAFQAEVAGYGKVLQPTGDLVGPIVFEAFNVRTEVIENRPEALRVFFEGYYETISSLQEQPDKVLSILVDEWGKNPEAAKRAVEAELGEFTTDGKIPQENLQGLAEATEFQNEGLTVKPDELYQYWGDL